LRFSTILRQPASGSLANENTYVEQVIEMLDMMSLLKRLASESQPAILGIIRQPSAMLFQ
jgi:hypothetical protein